MTEGEWWEMLGEEARYRVSTLATNGGVYLEVLPDWNRASRSYLAEVAEKAQTRAWAEKCVREFPEIFEIVINDPCHTQVTWEVPFVKLTSLGRRVAEWAAEQRYWGARYPIVFGHATRYTF